VAAVSICLARLCLRLGLQLPAADDARAASFVRALSAAAGAERESKRISLALAALEGRADARVHEVLVDACAESFAREVAFRQSEVSVRPPRDRLRGAGAGADGRRTARVRGLPRAARGAAPPRGTLFQTQGSSQINSISPSSLDSLTKHMASSGTCGSK
jgi:hypothetical protein